MVKTVWIRQLINGGNQFLFQIIWIYSLSLNLPPECIRKRMKYERPASTTPNMDTPQNYQTTYDSKTKIGVFYSLNIQQMWWKFLILPNTIPGIYCYVCSFHYQQIVGFMIMCGLVDWLWCHQWSWRQNRWHSIFVKGILWYRRWSTPSSLF